jgi:hypothetical protein
VETETLLKDYPYFEKSHAEPYKFFDPTHTYFVPKEDPKDLKSKAETPKSKK